MSSEKNQRFHDAVRREMEELDRIVAVSSEPSADHYVRRRRRYEAALDVDLDFRPPLVVRCDFEKSCQQTLARVYATTRGPLWVPSTYYKNDILVVLLELVDDPGSGHLPLPHCNESHHPVEFQEAADVDAVARLWKLAQDRRRSVGASSVAVRR